LTQLGFIRLSSNPHVIPHAVTPMDAVQMLQRYVALPQHLFWEDSLGCAHERLEWTRLQGHKQVTDAYLLALAASRGEKLATFDRAFIDLAGPARTGGLILLIPH
jgi:predicted nucleic acid-binding protein